MANGENTNGNRLVLLSYVGGLILAAGVLISIGQLINRQETNTGEIAAIKTEVSDIRRSIDAHIGREYSADDSVRDLANISGRLERLERRLERIEDRQ